MEVLEATHDDCKKEHTILCLINGQEIIVITSCIRSEPNIKFRLELGDGPQRYKFVCAKVKDHLLVLVTQNAVICIFSCSPLLYVPLFFTDPPVTSFYVCLVILRYATISLICDLYENTVPGLCHLRNHQNLITMLIVIFFGRYVRLRTKLLSQV